MSLPAPAEIAARSRVLVVDDNAGTRRLLRGRLERQGHEVQEAAGGREALDLLRSGAFDLVLLDLVMPGMDGFQVLAEMKADAALGGVPVIVISTLDEMRGVMRAIGKGAADYLFKPFDPVLLRARVSASLEMRRLRNELAVREKLASLGQLAAGVAHEIGNPLNFVNNFAGIALELLAELRERLGGSGDGEALELVAELERSLTKIREHGMRADGVVRSMLLHARGGAGERRGVDLNALVDEAARLARDGAGAAEAVLETDYDTAAGEVCGVPRDLSRALINIASNAFYAVRSRAGEPGFRPAVRVATRSLGARVEIRIRDNGRGIRREDRDRVFDPFFTTKPTGEGTGLGLSLAHDIVVLEHEGEIRVESEEGQGSEFILVLPRS